MGITLQQESLRTERVIGEGSRNHQVDGQLALPPGAPLVEGVQFCRARVRDLRATAAPGRALIEGLLELEMNYLSSPADAGETGQPEYLAVWSKENGGALNFTQEIPLAGIGPGAEIEAEAAITGALVDRGDGVNLRCQVGLDLSAKALAVQEVIVATDAAAMPAERLEAVKEILRIESPYKKAETEASVSAVLALPEVKPDLLRIISRDVRLTELKVEVIRGRAVVEGRLEVNAVYVSRTEDGQGIEVGEWGGEGRTPIAFEAFLDLPGLGPDLAVEPRGRLGRVNLEPIGPREVKLDAAAIVSVQARKSRQVPIVIELIPGAEELVDLRQIQASLVHLAGQAEQEIAIETTLELPPGKPDLDRILQLRVTPNSLTGQTAEGKCLVDGWLDVSLLYQADAPGGTQSTVAAAEWVRNQGTGVPVAEVLEMPEIGPGFDASLTWQPGRASVERLAPRTIRLTVTLPVKAKVTEERSISAIVDAALVPLAPVPGRPSMLFYVVQPGDTIWSVARRYDTTMEAIVRMNKIADPEILETGRKLLIPRSPVAV